MGLSMPVTIVIDQVDDPRLAPYQALRDKDLKRQDGLFVAEGDVVVRSLIRSRSFALHSLLIDRRRLDALGSMLATVGPDVPAYLVDQRVMSRIAGFPMHRGLLALGCRRVPPEPDDLMPGPGKPALVVAMLGIANHDNVGGIFRNAAAFGADGVLVDAMTCDPLYRKALRVGVGAGLVLPWTSLARPEDILAIADRHHLTPLALTPVAGERLSALQPPDRALLILGSKGHGLPDTVMQGCRRVSIPMHDGFDSLNVATTSGIVLHHLRFGAEAGLRR
jgi:tRNA G18 (ribose-2'-O)-methylase SpoU